MDRKDLIILISSVKSGARSGKSSFAQFMIDYISNRTLKNKHRTNYIIPQMIEFSSGLKDICRDVFCAPEEYVTGAFKESPLGGVSIKGYAEDASCRDIMRYLGTEVFRDHFGADIWVKRVHNKICQFISRYEEGFIDAFNTITIIPDFRFNNEITYLEEQGWQCIWVDIERPSQIINTTHRSENSLNLEHHKYEIVNDGDLNQLKKDAENFIGAMILDYFEPVSCC